MKNCIRPLSLLKLVNLEKRKCPYFILYLLPSGVMDIFSILCPQDKMKFPYLGSGTTNDKNKTTSFSQTLKIWEKNVSSFQQGQKRASNIIHSRPSELGPTATTTNFVNINPDMEYFINLPWHKIQPKSFHKNSVIYDKKAQFVMSKVSKITQNVFSKNVEITLFLWRDFGQNFLLAEGLWSIPCLGITVSILKSATKPWMPFSQK